MSIPGNFLELMIKQIVCKHLGKEVVITMSHLRFSKNNSCKTNLILFDRLNAFFFDLYFIRASLSTNVLV